MDGFYGNWCCVVWVDSFVYVGEGAGSEGLFYVVSCDGFEYSIFILDCFGMTVVVVVVVTR